MTEGFVLEIMPPKTLPLLVRAYLFGAGYKVIINKCLVLPI